MSISYNAPLAAQPGAGNQQIQQGFSDTATALTALMAKKRQLHPAIQQMLDNVITGNMTPDEAAAHAKLVQNDMHPAFSGQQAPQQPPGMMPQSPQPSNRMGDAADMMGGMQGPPQGMMQQPQQTPQVPGLLGLTQGGSGGYSGQAGRAQGLTSAASPGPQGGGGGSFQRGQPYTAEDMGDLHNAASFINAMTKDSSADKMSRLLATLGTRKDIAELTDEGKNNRQDKGIGSREKISADTLKFKYDDMMARMSMARQRIAGMLQKASMITGSAKDIAAARVLMSRIEGINNRLAANARSAGAYGGALGVGPELMENISLQEKDLLDIEDTTNEIEKRLRGAATSGPISSTPAKKTETKKVTVQQKGPTAEELNKLFGGK